MRGLLKIISFYIVVWALTGCVERLNDTQYRVQCTVDKTLGVDSVSMMVLEDSYGRVRHVSTVGLDTAIGAFVIEGQVEQPCVAFLKFGNDSTPFYFVLEHGATLVDVGARGVVVSGGDLNHEYFAYLKDRALLESARRSLLTQYRRLAAPDSMVNIEQEREFVVADSVLSDSLECLTVGVINRGDAVSRIVFERYVNTLSRNNLSKINHTR